MNLLALSSEDKTLIDWVAFVLLGCFGVLVSMYRNAFR
jgi:hypothetical protein